MTYTTPELLLVGAAQHLVLGPNNSNTRPDCEYDSGFIPLSDIAELW